MDNDEIVRLYGAWAQRTPGDLVELMAGYDEPWWIAGGWAIEAFTGVSRPHGDIDPSIPREDAGRLRRHLQGRFDVWAADNGTLRPLTDGDDAVRSECENLWLRTGGDQPWEYDVILMSVTDGRWVFKRDASIALPLGDILWEHDGVRYIKPEVQLLHKARAVRTKDQQDFEACLPLLSPHARGWLRDALGAVHPGHAWIEEL